MDQSKLFHVLVVGGALVGAGCEGTAPGGGDARVVGDDAAVADATSADNDAALVECGFCPNDCCVPDGMGGAHEREGFVCCWATSC